MSSMHNRPGGDSLGTLLREAAAHEILPPRPVAQTLRHAEVRRTRRRVTASVLALAVLAGGGVVARELLLPAPQSSGIPAHTGTTSGPSLSASAPSQQATERPSTSSAPLTTGDSSTTTTTSPESKGGTTSWPAPPTDHIFRPYNRAGVDFGEIVSLRRDGNRVVVTVNRQQYYTAEQWKQRTGEDITMDGLTLDESTRTRDFVVEPDAVIVADWMFHDDGSTPPERLTPGELVERGNALLERLRADGNATPGILVWMFHRGGENGPLAYIDDAAPEIG